MPQFPAQVAQPLQARRGGNEARACLSTCLEHLLGTRAQRFLTQSESVQKNRSADGRKERQQDILTQCLALGVEERVLGSLSAPKGELSTVLGLDGRPDAKLRLVVQEVVFGEVLEAKEQIRNSVQATGLSCFISTVHYVQTRVAAEIQDLALEVTVSL